MTHIGLFEGIGGFSLAARWMGWKTLAWCEWIKYKQDYLYKNFPDAKGYGDISATDFTIYRGKCDVLTGGFPCQDASAAKQWGEGQQGLQGKRTGLFYEFCRAIFEIRPRFAVFENVENILRTNGGADFSAILTELSRMGYNAEWRVCRGSEVGAPHHRARLYMVAYPMCFRLQKGQTFFTYVQQEASQIGWDFAGTTIQTFRGGAWAGQPPSVCVVDGLPAKLVRQQLHSYGNAIVPQIAFEIFKAINVINTTVEYSTVYNL